MIIDDDLTWVLFWFGISFGLAHCLYLEFGLSDSLLLYSVFGLVFDVAGCPSVI